MHAFLLLATLCFLPLLAGCDSDAMMEEEEEPMPESATYMVTFESTWSAATHPQDFPSNPHFSGLIGSTHTAGVDFWEAGQPASDGIESMAETGSKEPLRTEVNQAIAQGNAGMVLSGDGINPSPDTVSLSFLITRDFPLVTLVSMIAPSPDWFVGVDGLSLIENNAWVETKTVELHVYDAGTDSGANYTAPDADTNPPGVVTMLRDGAFLVNGDVPPVGTFTFVRQ